MESQSPVTPGEEEVRSRANSLAQPQTPEIPKEQLLELTEAMFTKASQFLQGELAVVKGDYQVLETMNKMTKEKYNNMGYLAENLNTMMNSLQEKYEGLGPYLEQIDQIEENVNQLEEATKQLDEYSKKLEAKFKKILEKS